MNSSDQIQGQITIDEILNLDSWCGKTCKAHSVQTGARILEPSLKKRHGSHRQEFAYLDLRENGRTPVALWVTDGLLLGDYTMLNFGECPSAEKESRLSQILEASAPPKYYLSAKACQGILNRTEKRGKALPPVLKQALESQITHLKYEGGAAVDRFGKMAGKGALIQTELSATLGVSQDQVLFANIPDSIAKDCGNGIETTDENTKRIYDARGNGNGHIAPTITGDHNNRITDYTAIICSEKPDLNGCTVFGDNISPTLVSGYYKMIGNTQDGMAVMVTEPLMLENSLEHGTIQNKGICTTLSARMGTGGDNVPMIMPNGQHCLRRLMPIECERLQGYPDNWTNIGEWVDSKGKKHKAADAPRYKALGNSIALPFWQWLAERMVKEVHSDQPTMASLFDGIGGFPLVYSKCGCEPVWASEIEEFPIAVTKKHFPEK